MSNLNELWNQRVANPEALGEGEKKLWNEIEPIINELLEELKANGKIEISFTRDEKQQLDNVLDNLTQTGKSLTLLFSLFKDAENSKKFGDVTSEFGFKENNWINLLIETIVFHSILNTEIFKLTLLLHLKDVDPKVSRFNSTMARFAPIAWSKLKPYVYSNFRNSLAHGTWALENKQVVLYEDAELIAYERLDLADLFIKSKDQNVLFICLVNVLAEKNTAKFFT